MDQIKQMKSANLEHFSSTIMRAEVYKGVSTLNLIEKFYPEVNKLAEVQFVADTGINPVIPIGQFLKKYSILAYERFDGQKFERFSKKEKILVPLSPLYLIWEINRDSSKEEKLTLKSLYQIRTINLYTTSNNFGVTEALGDQNLSLGIQIYKTQCISCHSIGSIGGNYSFSLIHRKTLKAKGSDYIKKYVLNPTAINPKTKMVQIPQFQKDEKTLEALIQFLQYIDDPMAYMTKKNPQVNTKDYQHLLNIVNEIKK